MPANCRSKTPPYHFRAPLVLVILLAQLGLNSCEETVSSVGLPFFADTITSKRDTSFDAIATSGITRAKIKDGLYNLTSRATKLIVAERPDVASWAVFGFSKLTSVGDTARLVLTWDTTTFPPPSKTIRYSLLPRTITDSTTIQPSELAGSNEFTIDSMKTIIVLTGAELSQMKAGDFGIALRLKAGATGYASVYSLESTPAATAAEDLRPHLLADSVAGTQKGYFPSVDFFQVQPSFIEPANIVTALSGAGNRIRIRIALDSLKDGDLHSGFVTVNSALLKLVIDRSNTIQQLDSTVALFSVPETDNADSAEFLAYGKALNDTLQFELRVLVERWLRTGKTTVLEVRTGAVTRTFFDKQIPVEDDNLERWTFYSATEADETKRPRLIVTYSQVK